MPVQYLFLFAWADFFTALAGVEWSSALKPLFLRFLSNHKHTQQQSSKAMPKLVLDGILSAFCAAAELCSKDDGVPSATKKSYKPISSHYLGPLFL